MYRRNTQMMPRIVSANKLLISWFWHWSWWHHQMKTFSTLLALYEGNPLVTCGFPSQRPVMLSFDASVDLRLNKWLSKQLRSQWFETPSCSLWCHCKTCDHSITDIQWTEKQHGPALVWWCCLKSIGISIIDVKQSHNWLFCLMERQPLYWRSSRHTICWTNCFGLYQRNHLSSQLQL